MRPGVFVSALALLSLCFVGSAARAQYMYFDSNGDGVHTAADFLNATHPTTADVWLDPLHDRDGSLATCNNGGDLSIINSYAVNLLATGGTVAFSGFVNRVPAFDFACIGSGVGFVSNDTEASICQASGVPTTLAYPLRLFTLTVSAVSGTPSIEFEGRSQLSFNPTSFGTSCAGNDFDNTYKLGSDWQDADGLPYGTNGPNRPPSLDAVADMTVAAGATATQTVHATDPDFTTVTITLSSGPGYVHVVPLSSEIGSASADIHVAPFASDVGTAQATIQAHDGLAFAERSLQITVTSSPNHTPMITAPSRMVAVAGATAASALGASDADGDVMRFVKISGPGFARVSTTAARPGGATGQIVLTPGACDLGSAELVIAVTDEMAPREQRVHIEVLGSQPPPSDSIVSFPAPSAHGMAAGDLNADGRTDVVLGGTGYYSTQVLAMLRTPDGFAPPAYATVGEGPFFVASGDLNEDGRDDVATANYQGGSVSVLLAGGDGALGGRVDYPVAAGVDGIADADVDADGRIDLIAAGASSVFILRGQGDGTFAPAVSVPAGGDPGIFSCLVVCDLDLDGRADIVSGRHVLRGLGGGAFLGWTDLGLPFPSACEAGDWNGDGLVDLAFLDWGNIATPARMLILAGHGDGSFETLTTVTGLMNPQGLAALDVDLDGDQDLAAGDWGLGEAHVWYLEHGSVVGDAVYRPAAPLDVDAADVNDDGYPDVIFSDSSDGALRVWLSRNGSGVRMAQGRAFVRGEHRIVPVIPTAATLSIRLEPVGDSYRNDELDLGSFRLWSTGTGSVESISPLAGKTVAEGDTDHNGVTEVPFYFSAVDLAALFQGVSTGTVGATLRGRLVDGGTVCAPVELNVVATGPPLVARVTPNPLNPQGIISFRTTRPGSLRVRVYDLMGRLAKTLLDEREVGPGLHEIVFDGTGEGGRRLASGAYFFKIEAAEGVKTGRLMLMR